jgi:transposase
VSTFPSDIFGASGRNIINHLASNGSITLKGLDGYLKTKTRHKINDIMTAMNGRLSVHQKSFLKMLLKHLEQMESNLSEVESEIAAT